jgi:hypothetical protein
MDSCCVCHPRAADEPALAFELRVAREAMAVGDLGHAKHHVAGALGVAPTDGRTLRVVDAFLALIGDVEAPPSGWFGEYALAAHALYRSGDRSRAVGLLAQVAEAMPHLGYEHTLTAWVSEGPIEAEATIAVARLLAKVGSSTIGLHRLWPGERALLASYGELAAALVAAGATGVAAASASGVLRRVGRFEEALAAAERSDDANGHIQRGLALRAMGDGLAALRAFERAESLGKPLPHERARCLFVLGDDVAVLGLVPPDAPDPELAGLRALSAAPPPGDRVEHLDALRRTVLRPALVRPGDATANLLSSHPQARGAAGLKVSVQGWESPTNRLLLAVNAGHTDVTRVEFEMAFTDCPRPVLAQVRGEDPLWVPAEGGAIQGLPAPDAALTGRLGALSTSGDLDAMWDAARALVGAAAPEPRALLAAMVHPPSDLSGDDLPSSVFRYQVACACALAALPTDRALAALESVAFGPVDWSSAAAVVALWALAARSPSAALRARALLVALPDDLVPLSTEPRRRPLLEALERLPGIPPSAVEKLRKHPGVADEAPEQPAPSPAPPVAVRPAPARRSGRPGLLVVAIVLVLGLAWWMGR